VNQARECDTDPGRYQSVNPLAHTGQIRSDDKNRSSTKRSMVSQSSKMRAPTKSMQSTTSEHVERTPKKSKILWKEPVLANVIADPFRGDFQGIDRVESILRTSNAKGTR
jgi:hypothetical protein